MLDQNDLLGILEFGGEQRSIEFKRAGSLSTKPYVAKVARAAIALANYRGGGYVILGIDDSDPLSGENGLDPDQHVEWTNIDLVNAKINSYADPALEIVIDSLGHPSGKPVVVLQIAEFREYPIMCKQDFGDILFAGQLFTRSAAKPESAYRQTHGEVREVIDLAVDKNLSRFLSRAQRGGLTFSPDGETITPTGYGIQLQNAVERNNELITSAHFQFTIRERIFEANRFETTSLRPRVAQSEVRHWGWSFPDLGARGQGQDWVAGGHRHERIGSEYWSFYKSGLFACSTEITNVEQDRRLMLPPGEDKLNCIPVHEPVVLFSMLLEFATRQMASLAAERHARYGANNRTGQDALPSSEEFVITIEAHGIKDWALAAADPQRNPGGFWNLYKYHDNVLKLEEITLRSGTTISDSRAMALLAATAFFHHFGWHDANPDLLRDTQHKVMDE